MVPLLYEILTSSPQEFRPNPLYIKVLFLQCKGICFLGEDNTQHTLGKRDTKYILRKTEEKPSFRVWIGYSAQTS